jgi:large subunit ribosomal protein L4
MRGQVPHTRKTEAKFAAADGSRGSRRVPDEPDTVRALASVLSRKLEDGEILFVDALTFAAPKAAEAKKMLSAFKGVKGKEDIASKKANTALIMLPGRDENTEKSFRNFGQIAVSQVKDVNPVELLTYKYVVVAKPDETLEVLKHRTELKSERVSRKAAKATAVKK